ncbi:conserved hypothetical protein [Mucor ambiguus]|uniref:CxC1-like cysteine cluster associated with KDZ transposases domain-containing protein n=1 Tax=Mucor ambiguus TaxID=91626 RepID=A0A0C9MF56_9FUNG|nr:conserved hypothetical protein [Mucor ambiguus]
MLHCHTSFTFKHCDEHPILKILLLMQMLPSSTVYPKVAIHFSVFEKLMSLKMSGYMSNHAFVKSQNNDNFLLANYDTTKFKFLNNGLFNSCQILYRSIKAHVLNDVYHVKNRIEDIGCHACHNSERVGVVLDGNFQMKRKNNQKIIENNEEHPSILSTTVDVDQLFGSKEEVEKYENEKDDCKDEACGLDEVENSFKAYGNNSRKKGSDRFDELGLFSMNCARHGIPMRLYDIYGGEATLLHVSIICLCKQKLEACIPELRNRDPLYLVTVFHAYAHSMHCQVEFHPRVVDGSGYTDGEGVERFWSICNRFSGMTRSMSKYNRKALITDVVSYFRQSKMLEIPIQVFKKYSKALEKINHLNITNKNYTELKKQWDEHVALLSTPATTNGISRVWRRLLLAIGKMHSHQEGN